MGVTNAGPTTVESATGGIFLSDVSAHFGSVTAISHVTIAVIPGRSLALVGSNGSGKSTVLNVIAGLLSPTSGTRTARSDLRLAYVPQRQVRDHWMPLTARGVLRMGRFGRKGLLGSFKGNDWMAVGEAASRLQVTDILDRQFGDLSGGQQQRVVVAQALAGDPDVLLLDEPLNGLDPPSQETILQLITDLADEGVAVAVATHDLDDARQCDEVALMDTSLHAIGTPEDVLTEANLEQIFGGRFHRV